MKENEIRITTRGMIRNYISYATSLLQVHLLRRLCSLMLWLMIAFSFHIDGIGDSFIKYLRSLAAESIDHFD